MFDIISVRIMVVFVWTPNAEGGDGTERQKFICTKNENISPAEQAKTEAGRRSWRRHWNTLRSGNHPMAREKATGKRTH